MSLRDKLMAEKAGWKQDEIRTDFLPWVEETEEDKQSKDAQSPQRD